MSTLTTAELKLIDSLFGMYGGWVLDFSNARFAAFFLTDVGVDIYDDAYAIHGTSKGKRLWSFFEVGQRAAIVRALVALWEYREVGRIDSGEAERVPDARPRLSAVIERLGGRSLPGDEVLARNAGPLGCRPAESVLAAIETGFNLLHGMDDAAQSRGYAFERFLKAWFDAWKLQARASFKLVGEQIDGSFIHRGSVYLLEAKWTNRRTDASDLRAFQEKAGDRFEGTKGLFVSYTGFTDESLRAFTARRVILMDGMDIIETISRRLSLDDVIAAKHRIASEERRPQVSVRELFR
ncbi:hypothetical protein C8J35_11617 [Rhizobium sp. PP-F2F-G38]|nr:hypothetical protein C8J35_11617 [Rhizobium sp. PP-F2F-G38]